MNQDADQQLAAQVLVMRIIVFALAMGVLTFGLILILIIRPEPAKEVLLAYIAAAGAATAIPLGIFIPRVMASQQPASVETYQAKLIVGAAIFESFAFFNLIVYMIEGQSFSLVIAGGLLVLILLHFPTVGGVQSWIESRERREREKEAFGR